MPAGPLAHLCLMVRDLDAAIERLRRVLGVLDPRQLEQPIVRYDHFSGGGDDVAMAIFVSPHGAEIQLLSPSTTGRRPDCWRAAARVSTTSRSLLHESTSRRVDEAARELRAAGLRLTSEEPMVDPGIPWLDFTFIAPDSANGTMIEICSPYEPVDGRWQPAQAAGASG